jgi:hypothetical protein
MLLRRVIEHVRTQNWTAITLDFVIVVVGVVIGIQVANWNQARVEQRELSASLSNLAQEISNTAWHRTDQIEWMRNMQARMLLMLDALDGRELSSEEMKWASDVLTVMAKPPPDPGRYETLYELQNTGLLRKVPSRELRAELGEILSWTKMAMPFYEMSLRTLTAPDFDPEAVKYGLEQSGETGQKGSLTVLSVDIDRARADPLFRRRIVQAYTIYRTGIRTNDASRRQDCEVLAMLKAQGYEPNGNWVIENLDRIVPDRPEKDLPDACKSEP